MRDGPVVAKDGGWKGKCWLSLQKYLEEGWPVLALLLIRLCLEIENIHLH